MSTDALEIMKAQRKAQIEESPFSETFYLDPTGARTEIKGIYDDPYETENTDQGQVRQQKRKPRILLNEIPGSIVFRTTKIEVRGEVFTIQKPDRDPEGVARIWLL